MKNLLLAGVLALVSVGANAEYGSNLKDNEITKQAKEMVTQNFKDPDSAVFKNITINTIVNKNTGKTERSAICGAVNAKNSYGGYAGYSNFVVTLYGDKPNVAVEGTNKTYGMLSIFCK